MTHACVCSKERDIGTLTENARWQNKILSEIQIDVKKVVKGHTILQTKVVIYAGLTSAAIYAAAAMVPAAANWVLNHSGVVQIPAAKASQ